MEIKNIKILFVCTGNTCRSPMALGVFRKLSLEAMPFVSADSAGLCAFDGAPASQNAVKACEEIGVDISSHRSKQLRPQDADADYFFVMTQSHSEALMAAGIDKSRIYLPQNIADPYGGDLETYRKSLSDIYRETEKFFNLLKGATVVIEPLSEKTLPFAVKAEKQCFAHPLSEKEISGRLSQDNTVFFIALLKDEPLGYIGMEIAYDEGYIFNAAVFEKHRRLGIGTALISRLKAEARKRSLAFITLEVRKSNAAAIRLYEKCGFEVVGERKNYYSSPTENALLMTMFFNKENTK